MIGPPHRINEARSVVLNCTPIGRCLDRIDRENFVAAEEIGMLNFRYQPILWGRDRSPVVGLQLPMYRQAILHFELEIHSSRLCARLEYRRHFQIWISID